MYIKGHYIAQCGSVGSRFQYLVFFCKSCISFDMIEFLAIFHEVHGLPNLCPEPGDNVQFGHCLKLMKPGKNDHILHKQVFEVFKKCQLTCYSTNTFLSMFFEVVECQTWLQ